MEVIGLTKGIKSGARMIRWHKNTPVQSVVSPAEGVGFEPTRRRQRPLAVFKTAAIGH